MKNIFKIIFFILCISTITTATNQVTDVNCGTVYGSKYIIGTRFGIYTQLSLDTNWVPANTGMGPKFIWSLTYSGTYIFAGTNSGIYRSPNGGENWVPANNGLTQLGLRIMSLAYNNNVLYAGTADGVFHSNDNGDSWIRTGNQTLYYYTYIIPRLGGTMTLKTIPGCTFITKDNCESWTGVNVGNSDNLLNDGSDSLYSNLNDFIEFTSTDGGETFTDGTTILTFSNGSWSGTTNGITKIVFIKGMTQVNTALVGMFAPMNANEQLGEIDPTLVNNNVKVLGISGGLITDQTLQNGIFLFTPSVPLPVELSQFNGQVIKSDIILKWKTATETNNYGFDIEKKSLLKWEKIGFVSGHGSSNSQNSYEFIDQNISYGKFVYRLKQIDRDGAFEYSTNINIEVLYDSICTLYQNVPNPISLTITLSFNLPSKAMVSLKIYTILGKEAYVVINDIKESGKYSIVLNFNDSPSGTYFYTLSTGKFRQTKKMMFIK